MKSLACLLVCCAAALAQNPLDPAATEWKSAASVVLALHRTPPLYSTDAPAALEIPSVQAQIIHGATGNFVRLEWADKTHDTTVIPKAERAWQGDHLVTQSAATDRFSDACAVMIPAKPVTGDLNPSLQMGDADHPVHIFVWDSTRGAAIMEASGRETTKRTGQAFPAQAQYAAGKWP
jgi:DMSO reductase family type II enzyme heme b subunit